MKAQPECPVDQITINQNCVRFTASQVLLLTMLYLFTGYSVIAGVLMLDFFLRGFGASTFSPLNTLSKFAANRLSLRYIPVNNASKQFAAQVGFIVTDLLFISAALDISLAVYAVATLLIVFAFLESAFSICVGCHIYNFLKKINPTPAAQG